MESVPLMGGLGKGRGSHAQRGPPMARKSAGMERDFRGIGGSEGTADSNSPACSGPGKPTGVLGLNRHPLGTPHSEGISRNREGP